MFPDIVYMYSILLQDLRIPPKGVVPGTPLAWPGWKQPNIPVEVDTGRLKTSPMEEGVFKKLISAGIANLSRLKYS